MNTSASATPTPFAPATRTVLVVGATAGIGSALVHEFARRHYHLVLAARDTQELGIIAADVRLRYNVPVTVQPFEAREFDGHQAFFERCLADCGGDLYGVLLCHGVMPGQAEAERDFAVAHAMIECNYSSCVSLLNIAANYMEPRGHGFLCALSSVAGDCGRAGNYIYGSTKGGLNVYMQGLRQRMYRANVAVTTVKPGPIDTALTWGLDKLPLLVPPEKAASDIFRALRRRQDVVYTPAPWRIIMGLMGLVPEFLWKRMKV